MKRGHSTTTWTEFCHFLDSFYTLSVDKKRHFWPPPPLHLVHVVVECPLSWNLSRLCFCFLEYRGYLHLEVFMWFLIQKRLRKIHDLLASNHWLWTPQWPPYVLPPIYFLVVSMIWFGYTDKLYIKMMGYPWEIHWNHASKRNNTYILHFIFTIAIHIYIFIQL